MKYKHLNLDSAQFKFDDQTRTFEGYASVFGGVDAYGDTIIKGAYDDTLRNRERPIRLRWNHYGPVIGKFTAIKVDEVGLWVKGELTPGHSVAEDAYASLKHGAVDGLSIGYIIEEADQNDTGGLDLKQVDLIEISVVEEPADLGAKISNVKEWKEAIGQIESLKDFEAYLRDACGLPRSAATALTAQCKTLFQSESGTEPGQSESGEGRLNWRMYRALKLNTETIKVKS